MKEANSMVPKVFISSTFYDLKYVRENLGVFIEEYGFTPIIAENGDISYTHYQSLDKSCYDAMRVSDMAILIIGGRYGSPASQETMTDKYFSQYKSVTRKEFEAARNNKVPIYVFIEAPVFYEYETYKKNINIFESGSTDFNFASIDNINVFRFISEIYSITGISVWSFNKVEDIKNKLKKQWAGLFLRYLTESRSVAMLQQMEYPLAHIDSSIRQMSDLLNKLLEKNANLTEEENQELETNKKIETVANIISSSFEFASSKKNPLEIKDFLEFFVDKLYVAKNDGMLGAWFTGEQEDVKKLEDLFEYSGILIIKIKEFILFQLDELDEIKDQKNKLVDRLLQNDCLRRMRLIII